MICAHPDCAQPVGKGCTYCSRSCAMRAVRARQSVQRRREIALLGRQAQRKDEIARLLARVMVCAHTERGRILWAYTLGKRAARSERYRERKSRVKEAA